MEISNDNDLKVKVSQCESELKELNNEINKILIEIENQTKFSMNFSKEKKNQNQLIY